MRDAPNLSERRRVAAVLLVGVALRLGFLLWASPLELWADEGQYAYQALAWNRFGFYLGSVQWVWPPGYPAWLALAFRLFGEDGLFLARLGQVLLSGAIGVSLVHLARRLFPARAARASLVVAALWAVYLPLIGFTHYLWPETLFLALLLPSVVWFLSALEDDTAAAPRMLAAGVALGGAFLVKESVLPLLVLLPVLTLVHARRHTHRTAREQGESPLALAGVLVLSAGAVVLPWTLRNHEVYGRWVPSGATMGENLYQGVNTHYLNYDYAGGREVVGAESLAYRWLVRPPAGAQRWTRSEAPNTIDKNAENTARAKRFALEHPGWFLRSRVKKVADWVTPLSFLQRQLRLGVYDDATPLAPSAPTPRRILVLASTVLTVLVLAGGALALFLVVPSAFHRLVLLAVLATFASGAGIVAMSRYRVPVEPFLLVLAGGWLAGAPRRGSRSARALALAALALLLALWALNAPEVLPMLMESLR